MIFLTLAVNKANHLPTDDSHVISKPWKDSNTVNSEILVRVLFSRNFENNILANGEITLSITDLGKSCNSRTF